MRSEIKSLQRQLGVTTILVTHDQLEATTMADRIICMRQGRIEQSGTPDDLYLRPISLFVAGFIGAPPINLLPGTAERGELRVERTTLTCAGNVHGPLVLGIRPEAVRFAAHGIQGRIGDIEPMGRETLYLVDSELGPLRVLEAGSVVRHRQGDQVALAFDPEAALIFDRTSERLMPDARLARAA
jgi:inositol-phosphate transport system ATP-binding protein